MRRKKTNWTITVLLVVTALVTIALPLYLTLIISLKSPQDMGSPLALPRVFHFENFINAIKMTNYFDAFKNSFIITAVVLVFTLISNSAVGYAIARNRKKKFFNFLYYYFLSAMFVPFSIIMLPLVKQASNFHLDNIPGIMVLYVIFGLPFNTFLYVAYMKSIPTSLDEAATIDGASTMQIFRHIIFPLLMPINATVAITTCLYVWNDFMLPLIILTEPKMATLPLAQYIFQSQFNTNYNLAFASYLLALLPMLIVYIFAQKFIINGVTAGGVKQ